MATVKEEFELLKAKILAGKSHEQIHIIYHDKERKRKLENPQQSTRVVLNLRNPETYKEFNREKERFFDIAVDPHIALHLLIRALRETTDETIRRWLTEGEAEEVPEWAKD
jgi:hypothetical protein